jgi:hypothetical protein
MSGHKTWKILQIIPAQAGWKAVHCEQSVNREIKIYSRPIICWALVQPRGESGDGQTEVRGMEQNLHDLIVVDDVIEIDRAGEDDSDRNQYFLGYNDPDAHKESDHWMKQGHERLRTEKEQKLAKQRVQAALRLAT